MQLFQKQTKSAFREPVALIMNMYYTGLGIARSLGRHRVPVLALCADGDGYGRFSKYGELLVCPNSREKPEELCNFLLELAPFLPARSIIFPTRDADTLFLDRFRKLLSTSYILPQVESPLLMKILNKQRLAEESERLGIMCPKTLTVDSEESLLAQRDELVFPAVIKPVYAEQWRAPAAWEMVGHAKAIKVNSCDDLLHQYKKIRPYCPHILVQAWASGEEDQFFIFGAYFDRSSECLGSFTAQKRLQYPPGFGTGCLVAAVERPEVTRLGTQLLTGLKYFGLAEVEFKYDRARDEYKLIEVNPRHWDQHCVGTACGVNLSLIAYQDLCGKLIQHSRQRPSRVVWIAELELARRLGGDLLYRRAPILQILRQIFSLICGRRVYGTFCWRDPMPLFALLWRFLLRGK